MNTYPGNLLYDLRGELNRSDPDWPTDQRGRRVTPPDIASRRRVANLAAEIYSDITDLYGALDPADRAQRDRRQNLVQLAGRYAERAVRTARPEGTVPRAEIQRWVVERNTWQRTLELVGR